MSAYRFCRTDDIGLLVEALNRCWRPYFPDEPVATEASFKRSIRALQVWCSSCMVAFCGGEPVGVLIGAKRSSATLVHRIAVHPDHRRHGHARHMLSSLGSKLAILGPPRIVAEVPETLTAACGLFGACGYVSKAILTDYVLQGAEEDVPELPGRFMIPVTVDDLMANGLLGADSSATPGGAVCWQRSVETLVARKEEIEGLAVASEDRIEASLLYIKDGLGAEVLSFRSFFDPDDGRLRLLVARLGTRGFQSLCFPRVAPEEISRQDLEALGFRPAGVHRRYEGSARSD